MIIAAAIGSEVESSRVARARPHVLEIKSHEEEDREGTEVRAERDDIAARKGGPLEERDVEYRVRHCALVEHEEDREEERGGEQQVDPEVPVARRLALDDGEGGGCEGAGSEKEAREVQAEADRVGALGQDQRRADECDQAEEQVEPEDGPERVHPYENATDQGPHCEREA